MSNDQFCPRSRILILLYEIMIGEKFQANTEFEISVSLSGQGF